MTSAAQPVLLVNRESLIVNLWILESLNLRAESATGIQRFEIKDSEIKDSEIRDSEIRDS